MKLCTEQYSRDVCTLNKLYVTHRALFSHVKVHTTYPLVRVGTLMRKNILYTGNTCQKVLYLTLLWLFGSFLICQQFI